MRGAASWRWRRQRLGAGQALRGRDREHAHLHRAADRRADATARRRTSRQLTGAKVQVITVPFSDLYNKLLTDFATGTNSYDAAVFAPQWMGDFIEPGYLEPLTERVKGDAALKWDDIAPFFRDFSASYKGEVYTIPLDGDFQMAYYRTDLLKEAGHGAAQDLGRLSGDRRPLQRQGSERRRQGRLRLVHLQEAQRPGLLVHQLDRRQLHPEPGHGPGRVLRHRDHDAADRQ